MNKLPGGPYKLPCIIELAETILARADRSERYENPSVYMKAIRATLIALGYNEVVINGEFRTFMEDYYNASGTKIFL